MLFTRDVVVVLLVVVENAAFVSIFQSCKNPPPQTFPPFSKKKVAHTYMEYDTGRK